MGSGTLFPTPLLVLPETRLDYRKRLLGPQSLVRENRLHEC